MQPEISHRCPACGASIRDFDERALFCPECGKPLVTAEAVAAQSAAFSDAADTPPRVDEPAKDEAPKLASDEVAPPTIDPSKTPRHGARERTRETLHRASSVARGAIEDNVKRVEKIHHVSSVMLEEAHYDPSLRFVLVALGLFVVFVLLLVLSKVMS